MPTRTCRAKHFSLLFLPSSSSRRTSVRWSAELGPPECLNLAQHHWRSLESGAGPSLSITWQASPSIGLSNAPGKTQDSNLFRRIAVTPSVEAGARYGEPKEYAGKNSAPLIPIDGLERSMPAKPVFGIRNDEGPTPRDVTPWIFWLPDLGSNQGPTD